MIIDGIPYYTVDEIETAIKKALKNNRDDCLNDDEYAGYELAEHAVLMELQKKRAAI